MVHRVASVSNSCSLTFAHRWKLVVEASIETCTSRRSYKKAAGVTSVIHRRANFIRASGIPICRCGHRHRGIRRLFWSTTRSWF